MIGVDIFPSKDEHCSVSDKLSTEDSGNCLYSFITSNFIDYILFIAQWIFLSHIYFYGKEV